MPIRFLSLSNAVLGVVLSLGLLTVQSAWAAKPDWVQGGAGDKHEGRSNGKGGHAQGNGQSGPKSKNKPVRAQELGAGAGAYFGNVQRQSVLDFYAPQMAAGKCPPGLAKKNNGCRPPGLVKQWGMGKPLPSGVTTYPLPPELQRRLGKPPAGHEFVRVAGDILLIAVGTSMVIDAIEDLTGQ